LTVLLFGTFLITQTTPHDSLGTLVFWRQKSRLALFSVRMDGK